MNVYLLKQACYPCYPRRKRVRNVERIEQNLAVSGQKVEEFDMTFGCNKKISPQERRKLELTKTHRKLRRLAIKAERAGETGAAISAWKAHADVLRELDELAQKPPSEIGFKVIYENDERATKILAELCWMGWISEDDREFLVQAGIIPKLEDYRKQRGGGFSGKAADKIDVRQDFCKRFMQDVEREAAAKAEAEQVPDEDEDKTKSN
jgi:hypothetical protein